MTVQIIRGNALDLPLADDSVDLVVTSPPYFGLRSYQDGGEHYDGQIGDEATPAEFVDALVAATAEMVRAVKPSGSIFVNLGDKYAAAGGGGEGSSDGHTGRGPRPPRRLVGIPAKSLMGIPWRYALRCIDDLGLILRAEIIWSKPNGLPESVQDRVRRSHEQWFHFTLSPRYYSAVDHIREEHSPSTISDRKNGRALITGAGAAVDRTGDEERRPIPLNPLGKLPGSVWTTDDGESLTRTVLSAVAEGAITIDEGERILWARREQASWPTSTVPATAGNGSDGRTDAATAKPPTSETAARNGHTESPTSCSSDPSPTASPSTTSAATSPASTPNTSSPSPEPRTSAEHTPAGPTAGGATSSQTTTTPRRHATGGSTGAAASAPASDSVWVVPTEPLHVPPELGIDHFAAYPTEFPRRIVQGWSPAGICTACGEGRRPVVATVGLDMARPQARRAQELADRAGLTEEHLGALLSVGVSDTGRGAATQSGTGKNTAEVYRLAGEARDALGGYAREYLLRRPTSFGEACACPEPTAPTQPGVVLDPFGGTGTTALVANALGRHGISVDMSRDYCRLATWRTTDPKQQAKAARRPYVPPREQLDGQLDLLEGLGA